MNDHPADAREAQAAALRARYPDWRVWYVPAAGRPATWHAEPRRYPLDAAGPDELDAAIEADQDQAPAVAWCGDPQPHAGHEHHGGARWCEGR